MPKTAEVAIQFFLQIAVVLAACRVAGLGLRRLGQTQVVADMVAGFLLGPTLFGLVAPELQEKVFPTTATVGTDGVTVTHPTIVVIYVIGQLGLVLYMFLVGLSMDRKILSRHAGESASVSSAGIVLPLLCGGTIGWLLATDDRLFSDGTSPWQAGLFVGAAIAITAFPMLARIIYDNGLSNTRIGTVALACAAADDAVAWILLAVVTATSTSDPAVAIVALVGTVAYLVVMKVLGKSALPRFGAWTTKSGGFTPQAMMATMLIVFVCAWYTDIIGLYSVFGAFVVGVAMPRGRFAAEIRQRVEPLTTNVLLPMFFVYAGLNTQLSVLGDPWILGVFALVLVVAFAAKGGSVVAVSRLHGASWPDALSLGALMNARGLMELILLNIGKDIGLITPQLYTVLALMTVVTTLAASPIYLLVRRYAHDAPTPTADADADADTPGQPLPAEPVPADRAT